MKSTIFVSSVLAVATLFSTASFADAAADRKAKLQTIYKSNNIKQGLINNCVEEQNKLGASSVLSKTEVTQLCKCNIESEGRMTQSQQWDLQSAQNAKDQTKFKTTMQSIAKTEQPKVKACLGAPLEKKLSALQQQAAPKK